MNYPFDTDNAYRYQREALISGAHCDIDITPDDIIKVHTYIKKADDNEDGMADCGADIYFEGIKEGTATVTLTIFYPTWEPEICVFDLAVNADLVTCRID